MVLLQGHGLFVVQGHGQSGDDDVQAGCCGGVEALVVDVGFVDDVGGCPQDGFWMLWRRSMELPAGIEWLSGVGEFR